MGSVLLELIFKVNFCRHLQIFHTSLIISIYGPSFGVKIITKLFSRARHFNRLINITFGLIFLSMISAVSMYVKNLLMNKFFLTFSD